MAESRLRPQLRIDRCRCSGHYGMKPVNAGDVESFVRATLGCGCQDEVFRSVSIRQVPAAARQLAHTEMLVGSRLLIRVFEAPPDPAAATWLERLVADGRAERDRHGYNRFRLVVVVPAPTRATGGRTDLAARFARASAGDERVHLHLLTSDQLPVSLRAPAPRSAVGVATPSPAAVTLAK
jgi:hypothetical protein